MAYSLNKVQIIGNLTRDPESRQTPGGQMVATFSVATSFGWTDSSGQKQDKTEYHNVVAWRKLAEICSQYLKKGTKVYIEGRLQTRDWEGEDGVRRYKTEIVADNMIILSPKGSGASNMGAPAQAAAPMAQQQAAQQPIAANNSGGDLLEEDISIDDLPF